jgi:hypothetical protein
MGFDNATVLCDEVAPPGATDCSTGAATWMATQSPVSDACCFYTPAQWARPCLHRAAGEKV